MKKLLVLFIMSILVVSCGENNSETKVKTESKKIEIKVEKKYGDLTDYIKSDITDTESKELLEILEQRKERQTEVKKMIEEATAETKDEIYNSIVEKRKICSERISKYVSEAKISSFKKYCEKANFEIKKTLDKK